MIHTQLRADDRSFASLGSTSRHAPWGHGPRNVSLSSGGSGVHFLLTGYTSEIEASEKIGGPRKRRRFELVDYKRNVCWRVEAMSEEVGRCRVVDMNCDVAHFGILGTEVR